MAELIQKDIGTLRNMLQDKQCSSEELVSAYLKQIADNEDLNAFLEVWSESAINEAKEADAQGGPSESHPLRGIPIAIKDIFTVDQGQSTAASQLLKSYHSPFTATVVNRLVDAGAIILGKTNLDEFAMGSSNENSSYGSVKNPWDKTRVPGGSSGGSTAAVAASLAPAALGTDTGGSIRQPSALCGVTGLKPTYGRMSRYGMIAFSSSLDQAGPIARTANDCALIGRVMAGKDENDSTSVEKSVTEWEVPLEECCKGLKIGVPKEYFIDGIESSISKAVEAVIKKFESLGAERVEISLPHTDYAIATYYIINPAEASSNLARFDGVRYGLRSDDVSSLQDVYVRSRSEGFGREVKRRILMGTYVLSSGYYDAYYLRAQKVRRLIQQDFFSAFQNDCDMIICPTTPTTAFPLGSKTSDPLKMYLNDVFTVPVNLAGLPGLSMPCGFDESGLPIGVQLIGNAWEEHRLLSVAEAYQRETDWHTKVPVAA